MKYIVAGIGGQGILFATKVLGHIALQVEGQGVWFRNIELKSLEEP